MKYLKVSVEIYSKYHEEIGETIHFLVPINNISVEQFFNKIKKILSDNMYKDEWISSNIETDVTFDTISNREFKKLAQQEVPFVAVMIGGAIDNSYLEFNISGMIERVSKGIHAHECGETVGV